MQNLPWSWGRKGLGAVGAEVQGGSFWLGLGSQTGGRAGCEWVKPEAVRTQSRHRGWLGAAPTLSWTLQHRGAAPGPTWISPGTFSSFTAMEKMRKGFSLPLAQLEWGQALSLSDCLGSA